MGNDRSIEAVAERLYEDDYESGATRVHYRPWTAAAPHDLEAYRRRAERLISIIDGQGMTITNTVTRIRGAKTGAKDDRIREVEDALKSAFGYATINAGKPGAGDLEESFRSAIDAFEAVKEEIAELRAFSIAKQRSALMDAAQECDAIQRDAKNASKLHRTAGRESCSYGAHQTAVGAKRCAAAIRALADDLAP